MHLDISEDCFSRLTAGLHEVSENVKEFEWTEEWTAKKHFVFYLENICCSDPQYAQQWYGCFDDIDTADRCCVDRYLVRIGVLLETTASARRERFNYLRDHAEKHPQSYGELMMD